MTKTKKSAELPATLSINQEKLTLAPSFQNMLDHISQAVGHAQALATVQDSDLGNLDESELITTIDDLSQAQSLARQVNTTRRDLKRYLKGRSDKIVDQFDQALDTVHFKELANYDAKAKNLKKRLSAYRINQRWETIKATFDKNIQNYPIIHELAPDLENFDTFRVRHPKLVTGAKSWKFGDKQMAILNQDLFDMNECLTDLKTNTVHLGTGYQNAVLQSFIAKPTKANYLEIKDQMITRQAQDIANAKAQKEAEAKRKQEEAEAAKQAAIAKQKQEEAARAAQAQNQAAQLQAQQEAAAAQARYNEMLQKQKEQQHQTELARQKQITDNAQARDKGRKWLADYVAVNYKYHNIAGNDDLKAGLIYDLIHGLDNPSSRFYTFIKSEQDKEKRSKLLLSVIAQILNV